MRPIQVFLPRLGYSLGYGSVSRDARRAFEEWDGAGRMYLLPDLQEPDRWVAVGDEDRRVAIQSIPAENLDDLVVFHVGSNGVIWDSDGYVSRFLQSVDGLLEAWINVDLTAARFLMAPEFTLHYPAVERGRIVRDGHKILFDTVKERLSPGPGFPMSVEDKGPKREFALQWPPPGTGVRSVDPDAESADAFGERTGEEREGVPGAIDEAGNWNPHLIVAWPGIFGLLIGPASGMGPFQLLNDMRDILGQAKTDRTTALRRAKAKAAACVSEGLSRFQDAIFMPTGLQTRSHGALLAFWEGYGIKAATLEEAIRAPLLKEPVAVTRAWGGEGLLWALLLDRLERNAPIRFCERCERMLTGRKKLCGPDDDSECF